MDRIEDYEKLGFFQDLQVIKPSSKQGLLKYDVFGKTITAEEVKTEILKFLRKMIRERVDLPIDSEIEALISVPGGYGYFC